MKNVIINRRKDNVRNFFHMEVKMKKSLIILFVILILATTFIGYFIYNYRIQKVRTQKKNTYYESYYQKEILGTELATIK